MKTKPHLKFSIVATGIAFVGIARGTLAAPVTKAPALRVIASGLKVPWAMALAPDGRLFLTERPGRIRVIQNGRLLPAPWRTLGVTSIGESGLLGIALAPDFERSRHLYVIGTYRDGGHLMNRVYRFTDRNGRGVEPKLIVDGIPAGNRHCGDALGIGPDGVLYIGTGDVRQPRLAQDVHSLAGKILRYRLDGTVPRDNPFPGSPVYALGLRNPEGLTWDRATGTLFATEHGPSGFANEGGRKDHDEVNVIRRGANYGWPFVSGMSSDPRFMPPLAAWTPAIAPASLAYSKGRLFIGGMRGQQLRRLVVVRAPGTKLGWRVVSQQALFPKRWGRIRAVVAGPNGTIDFATSNRDQISTKAYPGDDRVLQLMNAG